MKNRLLTKALGLLLLSGLYYGCSETYPPSIEQELAALPKEIDYNFHIKPILSDRCFACHGPDAQKREGELRLDEESGAYAALASGAGHAIVPGSPAKSQLVQRILNSDPELVMPPPESNLYLNDQEKALLIRWVEEKAIYKAHWAFTKPEPVDLPLTNQANWCQNEIDQFVLHRLEEEGVSPAPAAEKHHLIRRLFFDLNGLPPSMPELDYWLGQTGEDWYENLVDTLLAKPAFGERMAAHWLDVARFADSEGYLDDFHHAFWPYRDWLIRSFNENLPYDKFILWQVGGDQLPEATTDQILATAFNRNHKQNSEGGIIAEEFRVEYVADRTNTVGTAFMGLTMGCARCHDHKYDPISQEDYYKLFSFFNSTIERGDGIFSANAIEYGQGVSNFESMNSGPVLALPDPEVAAIRDFLLQQISSKQDSIRKYRSGNLEAAKQWAGQQKNAQELEDRVRAATVSHLTFDDMEEGTTSDLAKGNKAATFWGGITAVEGRYGRAIRSDASGQLVAEGKKAAFERMEPFTVSFWINTPKLFERAHVLFNGNARIQGYRGWDVVLDSNRIHFRLNHAHPYQSLDIRAPETLKVDEWTHFVWTYNGSSKAAGMRLFQDGKEVQPVIERDYLYRSAKPYFESGPTVYMAYGGITVGKRHYDQDFTGGLLDEIRILNQEAGEIVAQYLYEKERGAKSFLSALSTGHAQIHEFYDLFVDPQLERQRRDLRRIQAQEVEAIDTVREIMVMGDSENARPTFVLDRGVYDAHGKPVGREVPTSILPWPEELPRNRSGLGQWLIHPDHPLTARVAVNQMWYLMFGRGIVETVEDFGNQGALPSHPALLDWLALKFQESDWDLKELLKLMVSSATYRQSSKIRSDIAERDPENQWLHRGPRYRRSAEMVRDNILAVSGLLNNSIGGASTFPYQPPGLWKEVMTHTFFPEYQEDPESGLYRRSIYTFWKRNMPAPSMLIFDASSRAECQVRRQRSSTPLQALVLLNDPQAIEGCRALAELTYVDSKGDAEKATATVFRSLTSREPSEKEQAILKRQYLDELAYFQADQSRTQAYLGIGYRPPAQHVPAPELAALARVANTVLNSTEAYYKN
ncbi:MAG: DUF1553 domain-containing protein [Saprospiraceae bacterium]|nr:DUF1553 domain-containing protein [Saprospiraceae bacterium]